MAYDDLLRLTGPVPTAAVPFPGPIEAAAVAADAVGTNSNNSYKFFGKNRSGIAECRIGGDFVSTGTLTFTIREATNAAGAGATPIASSAALATTNRANYSDQALTTTTGSGKAPASHADGPTRVGFSTGTGGWIAVFLDTGGTGPSASTVSCDIVPLGGYKQSGS